MEESPALSGRVHDRLAPGPQPPGLPRRPAGRGGPAGRRAAPAHGWTLLFPDRHPHAGGPETYAAYLADGQGYEVELVASPNA